MNSSIFIQFLFLIFLLALSAFFSSAETSMTAVNKIRIQAFAEIGNKRAITLLKILNNYDKMLSAVLIGNNIVNISASALATTLALSLWGNVAVSFATGLLTLFVLILGEITPKTLASLYAEKISLSYAGIIYFLMWLLTPFIVIVNTLSKGVLFLLRIDRQAKTSTITEHELRTYLKTGQEEGVIENEEQQMIYNVFDFGDSMVKDVMVPRIDMQMVSIDANYKDLIALVREEGYTRFPVYDGSIDSIVGTINIKDLFSLDPNKDFSLKDILRTPFFTYEYKKTAPLLMEMKNQSISLAIVLDEYGATAGLVTLEDLLEEIVGEIKDEYDQAEPDEIMPLIANKVYRVFGSTKLDDVNESLGLQLFSKEYDSVGGFIIEQLDFLPSPGQILTIEGQVELKVLKVYRKRIETVKITLLQGKNPESEDIENPPS